MLQCLFFMFACVFAWRGVCLSVRVCMYMCVCMYVFVQVCALLWVNNHVRVRVRETKM